MIEKDYSFEGNYCWSLLATLCKIKPIYYCTNNNNNNNKMDNKIQSF
jgi:hypothetical protein